MKIPRIIFKCVFWVGGNYKQNEITEHVLTASKTAQRQLINKSALVCHAIHLHLCVVFEVVKTWALHQAIVCYPGTHWVAREQSKGTKEIDAHNWR